jgi:methionyl-tRNA formyltransferase
MQVNKPGIIFMGTPEFAVASLSAILRDGYSVKGVVTAPDQPSGRGLQMKPSPVKEFALQHGVKVMQPLKLRDPVFLHELQALQAELFVVVAFRMLPEEVWGMPPLGTFNLHASLLPQYRGAAPINHAVMNGEIITGVTTFFINHEIDKGSILFSEKISIGRNDTAGDVHDRLMLTGAELVVKTIAAIASGKAKPFNQQEMALTEPLRTAPKIFRNDCRISWNSEAGSLYNFIRGLSPHPCAWSELLTPAGEKLTMKIYFAAPLEERHDHLPGTLITDGRTSMKVSVKNGFLNIEKLQLQGKKQMRVEDFLRGFPEIAACRFL